MSQRWGDDQFRFTGSNGVGRGPGMPGLNMGFQVPHWQQAGPSGTSNGPALGIKPWPYITHCINFFVTYPYGAASSAVAPKPWPYATGSQSFVGPIGYFKRPSGPNLTF